eukprot:COSAG06_NODE_7245_length_2576_cov_1.494341_2_plen_60_part_00
MWCLRNASLGSLVVWGVPLDNNFTKIGFSTAELDRYTRLTGNGEHSTVAVGEDACMRPA